MADAWRHACFASTADRVLRLDYRRAAMSRVARYAKMVVRRGKGAEAAERLLAAAAELEADPGCELYLINRQAGEPDVVWVTEVWRSQADLDAAVDRIRGSEAVAAVMALVADAEMIELEPQGGKGLA
jgi:quinol monooxygenase YgiN